MKLQIEQTQRNKKFRFENEITERGAVTKGKGKILPPSGRQDNAFGGRQMGLAREENLVVFYIRLPRETERLSGKKWSTQEDLALNQPWSE